MKKIALILLGLFIVPMCMETTQWTNIPRANAQTNYYDYPFINPYESTVLGTPEMYEDKIPSEIRVKERTLKVFKERKVPDILWYHDKMKYSIAFHKEKAPLIVNIAGTGAGYNSTKMIAMRNVFFNAGFHVLSLSSPTHPNFIVSASDKCGQCCLFWRMFFVHLI